LVVCITGVSTIAGWRRGIITGLFTLGAALCGLVVASHAYAPVGRLLYTITTNDRSAGLLAFGLLFAGTLAAGVYAGYRLRKALDRARLRSIDRLFGALVGLVRAWLVCSAIYLGLTAFPVRLDAVEHSLFAPILVAGTEALAYLGSDDLRRRFSEGYDSLERSWIRD